MERRRGSGGEEERLKMWGWAARRGRRVRILV